MIIYITKYALTTGICKADAEINGDMAVVRGLSVYPQYFHGEGNDWHMTIESALSRAEEMRIKKLKSLDKKMKEVSALVFEAP